MLRTAIGCLLVVTSISPTSSIAASEPAAPEWLRGSGKDLEMRLQGDVLDADGKPATEIEFLASISGNAGDKPLEFSLKEGHFTVWAPVNRAEWNSMCLGAMSRDAKLMAFRPIPSSELRQAAIDGVVLKLQPGRPVKVTVLDQGKPTANAYVKAMLDSNIELKSTTDAKGAVTLMLPARQQLEFLTAWTDGDERRIGGHQFARTPARDPSADEQTIELSKCREQKMRFVAKDGTLAPNVKFSLNISTGDPHYNFVGSTDHSRMTSDKNGEAVFSWFPDWKESTAYPELNDDNWLYDGDPKMVDGVLIFPMTKRAPRKTVSGRVTVKGAETPPGGFEVLLGCSWSERENYVDMIYPFTNADGTFSADVLPDRPYCIGVVDPRYPSNIIDQVLYDSKADKINSPELEIADGQPVEVAITSGPTKRPLANMSVSFRRNHQYSARIDGKQETAIGSIDWWARTDENGIAHTRTLPGELEISVYTAAWRDQQKFNVAAGESISARLHRKVEGRRQGIVKLTLAPGLNSSLDRAEVKVGALDGEFSSDNTMDHAEQDGTFKFQSYAATIGIFARTADGKAAGTARVEDWNGPIEVVLTPTMDFEGRLLWKDGSPVAGKTVQASIHLDAERTTMRPFPAPMTVNIDSITDADGNYTFFHLPTKVKIQLSSQKDDRLDFINEIYLEPNEIRPRAIERIGRPGAPSKKTPLAERYQSTLRDCRVGGYLPMILISDDAKNVQKFVDENLIDYDSNHDVAAFIQLPVTGGKQKLSETDVAFLKERGWPSPEAGKVLAITLDATGKELGREEIEIAKEGSVEMARNFAHKQTPARHDAEAEWNAAFDEAKRTNRRVWVRISGRYCAPCFALSRWLDRQRAVLAKDFVMLKIDDDADTNGEMVAKRLEPGIGNGVPFHAIFDSSGKLLVNSVGPLGNVGYPTGFDGKKQLRKMLQASGRNLSDAEIDALVESVGD